MPFIPFKKGQNDHRTLGQPPSAKATLGERSAPPAGSGKSLGEQGQPAKGSKPMMAAIQRRKQQIGGM